MKKGIGGRVKRVVRGYTELLKEFGCLHEGRRKALFVRWHEYLSSIAPADSALISAPASHITQRAGSKAILEFDFVTASKQRKASGADDFRSEIIFLVQPRPSSIRTDRGLLSPIIAPVGPTDVLTTSLSIR